MPAMSSTLSRFVNVSSYCNVKPSTSNDASGDQLSSEYAGTPASRISFSMSIHGEYARSHTTPGCVLRM